MKKFFEGIAWLFEEVLFIPFNILKNLGESGWTLSNVVNWLFIIIGFVALSYWIKELNTFNKKGEEDKDPTAHSFL